MTKDLIPKEWNILLERTLADVTNAFVPIADYLQQKGNPLGERLVNLDIHSKLDELIKLSCGLTLDLLPADNGSKRTQDQWFNQYWNTVTAGTVMASMGDLYRNFKTLKRVSEQGTVEQKMLAQTLLASLRDDFDWPGKNLLISSTRINYAENKSLDGEIIHHYDRPDFTTRTSLPIPIYRDAPITEVAADNTGLRYLQVLHDTNDSAEEIIDTLKFVGNRNDLRVWTAAASGTYTRDSNPSRAAGFFDYINRFYVNGNDVDLRGRSRGVCVRTL